MNAVCKYAWHKWFSNREKWYPIAAVYYLTYRCAFRCGYCSDGNGTPYYALADEEVAGEHAFAVIQKIRKYADCLILTGGEPLSFPDLEYVLERLPELAFKEVVFTTNGHHLQHHLDSVAQAVTHLIVSVDTMNPVKADELTGMPTGTFQTILANLEGAKNKEKKRYTIYISSVATPDNLEDLREVYEFAKKKRLHLCRTAATCRRKGASRSF
ncbi:radical SAM protein [Desulfobulbus sp. US4]|nr:radical SAM protein [Desulfobulbus sp. US4]